MPTSRSPAVLVAVLFCAACSERSGEPASAGHALTSGSLLLNECSAGNSGFFELINVGPALVDLVRDLTYCFSIDDIAGGGSPKQITDSNVNHAPGSTTCAAAGLPATCALLAPGERVWIGYSSVNSTTDDSCRLLRHVYATTGCSGFYEDLEAGGVTHATATGQCFGRQPDGSGWQPGAIACTPAGGSNGGGAACAVGASCDDANTCTTGESWSSACSCTGGAAVSCDDANPCTADTCAAATGCAHQPLADGTVCSGGACQAGECVGAVVMPVVINEFMPGSTGWVELYNPRSTEADLGGYQIDDVAGAGGAPYSIPEGTTIPARGYKVFPYSSINTASKDDVRLVAANCGACSAGPGDTTSNFYASTSLSGKCFGRQPDGGAWAAASLTCSQGLTNGGGAACTPGSPCNDGNACTTGETLSSACACTGGAPLNCDDGNACTADPCATGTGCAHPSVADGTACGSGGACKAGVCATPDLRVVINEFQAGSSGWVELYNPRSTAADIGGYLLDDVAGGGGAPSAVFPAGTLVPARGYRVFAYGAINTSSKDDVRFVASACGACSAGPGDSTSNFYTSYSIAGMCLGRKPDGGDWWVAGACTPGASNGGGGQACTPGALCDDGKPCTFRTYWDSNCVCTEASLGSTLECDDHSHCTVDGCDPATGCTHTPVADGTACLGGTCKAGACVLTDTQPQVVINEFMAGDKGWIELYNLRDTTVDVGFCYIDDLQGSGGAQVQIPWGTKIPAKSVKLFPYGMINTGSKDDVNFYASPGYGCAAGIVADSHSNFYAGSSTAGKCYGRQPDGGAWAASSVACSQGVTNPGAGAACSPGSPCDDANACTSGETWSSTCTCGGGTAVSCDDSSACTTDGCAPASGCTHTPLAEGTSCGTNLVCQSGVCATVGVTNCAATGGTYKTVNFTKAEECKALEMLNKARYSQLAAGLSSTPARIGYDCAPDGTCGYRRAVWTSLAQYANFGTGTSCTVGATSLSNLKTLSASWIDDGMHHDTVANDAGASVTYERVYVESAFTSGSLTCAIVRDAPGAAAIASICDSTLNEGHVVPGSYVGSYVWVRATGQNVSTSMNCGAFGPFGSPIQPANPNPL